MGTYATTGDEMSILIGASNYRSYKWQWNDNVNSVNAPAFCDAVGVNATVITAIQPTLSISFREQILDELNYTASYVITFTLGTTYTKYLTCKLVDKSGSGDKTGIGDFGAVFSIVAQSNTAPAP